MAQWARVQGIDSVRAIYGPQFPVELRHFFAPWIEEQPWSQIVPDDPDHHPLAVQVGVSHTPLSWNALILL